MSWWWMMILLAEIVKEVRNRMCIEGTKSGCGEILSATYAQLLTTQERFGKGTCGINETNAAIINAGVRKIIVM
jgi:hypothetical protein